MLSTNKVVHAENALCQNYKYVCNRFNTSFCFKNRKTYQAISCYTLLHQAKRSEGKNNSKKPGDFLLSHRDA